MNRMVILVLLACTAVATCAGADYQYVCDTPGCSFGRPLKDADAWARPPLQIGYYDLEGHISGYCYGCDKFVTLRWKSTAIPKDVSTNLPHAPPQKLATIWVPCATNILILYPCAECGRAFVEVDGSCVQETKGERVMFCPKCNKLSLELNKLLQLP